MLFETHLPSTTYFSSSGITVKPQVMQPASASLKVTPTSRQMKATQQRFVLTFFDCFNLVRDQRTSCVPSIQRGSPSQPVPLIFGMTCAGIGGIEKMSRSGPTRMLPSGNWIHLWENFWRCCTGFARRTALLKCLNKWKYMQIMSHSIATWSVFAAVPGSCGPSTQLLTWSASALQSKLMGRMCKKTLA